jgi:hypothetical protein
MPRTGKVCATCNTKKVQCSYLGAKPSAKVIILSNEEDARPRPKKAKMSGLVPKARKVSAQVGELADRSVEILDAIWHQNALLGELLLYQEQTALATHLQAKWVQPMMNYLDQISWAMEA